MKLSNKEMSLNDEIIIMVMVIVIKILITKSIVLTSIILSFLIKGKQLLYPPIPWDKYFLSLKEPLLNTLLPSPFV